MQLNNSTSTNFNGNEFSKHTFVVCNLLLDKICLNQGYFEPLSWNIDLESPIQYNSNHITDLNLEPVAPFQQSSFLESAY